MPITVSKLIAYFGADTREYEAGAARVQNGNAKVARLMRESNAASDALDGALSKLGINAKTFTAAGLGAMAVGAAVAAVNLGTLGAQAMRLEDSFASVARSAGSSSDAILASLRRASSGTIADSQLILAANRAMLLGLGSDAEQLGQLLEVARFRGRAMGLDTAQAFSDIVTGVGRMSPLILDNLGIVVNAEARFKEYADSVGRTAESLTDAEKKQVLMNSVIAEGQKQIAAAGGITDDYADSTEQAAAALANAKEALGEFMAPFVSGVAKKVTEGINAWSEASLILKGIWSDKWVAGDSLGAIATRLAAEKVSNNTLPWYSNIGTSGAPAPFASGATNEGMAQDLEDGVRRTWIRIKADEAARDAGVKTGKAFVAGVQDPLADLKSAIAGVMSPTSVDEFDILSAKLGKPNEHWDEYRRRMQDIANQGGNSPWAAQYGMGGSEDEIRWQAMKNIQSFDMGDYSKLPPEEQAKMKEIIAAQARASMGGQAMKDALVNGLAGEMGLGIATPLISSLGTGIKDKEKDVEAVGAQIATFIASGAKNSGADLSGYLLDLILPGIIAWLTANGYGNGGGATP